MKKVLRFIVIGIFALAVLFFSLGLFIPTFSFDNVVEVNKPIEKTFAEFNDVSNMYKWIPGFQFIEPISGWPNEVGSKWKLVVKQEGKRMELIETMTACKENEVFAFNLSNEMMSNDIEIVFTSKGQRTLITAHNKVSGKNIFWKSLFVVSKSYFKNVQQKSYEKLKIVIEEKN